MLIWLNRVSTSQWNTWLWISHNAPIWLGCYNTWCHSFEGIWSFLLLVSPNQFCPQTTTTTMASTKTKTMFRQLEITTWTMRPARIIITSPTPINMKTRHAHADHTRCSNESHHRHHLSPNPSRSHRKKRQKQKTGKKIFFGKTISFTNYVTSGRRSRYSTTCSGSNKWQEEPVLDDMQWIEFGMVCPQWSSIHWHRGKTSSRKWMDLLQRATPESGE